MNAAKLYSFRFYRRLRARRTFPLLRYWRKVDRAILHLNFGRRFRRLVWALTHMRFVGALLRAFRLPAWSRNRLY